MPRGLFDLMVLANSYTARSDAYIYLLSETYPPFQDDQTRTAGTSRTADPGVPAHFLDVDGIKRGPARRLPADCATL